MKSTNNDSVKCCYDEVSCMDYTLQGTVEMVEARLLLNPEKRDMYEAQINDKVTRFEMCALVVRHIL